MQIPIFMPGIIINYSQVLIILLISTRVNYYVAEFVNFTTKLLQNGVRHMLTISDVTDYCVQLFLLLKIIMKVKNAICSLMLYFNIITV